MKWDGMDDALTELTVMGSIVMVLAVAVGVLVWISLEGW